MFTQMHPFARSSSHGVDPDARGAGRSIANVGRFAPEATVPGGTAVVNPPVLATSVQVTSHRPPATTILFGLVARATCPNNVRSGTWISVQLRPAG